MQILILNSEISHNSNRRQMPCILSLKSNHFYTFYTHPSFKRCPDWPCIAYIPEDPQNYETGSLPTQSDLRKSDHSLIKKYFKKDVQIWDKSKKCHAIQKHKARRKGECRNKGKECFSQFGSFRGGMKVV